MVFPCLGTVVLAHEAATFGFPEIRRGVLPGVVSVAALHRLTMAACQRLFCTGDTVDASTALRLGLVEFIGNWEKLDAELMRLVEHLLVQAAPLPALAPALTPSTASVLPVPQHLPSWDSLIFEADDASQIVRLEVSGNVIDLDSIRAALSLLPDELDSLRVIILRVCARTLKAG